MARCGRCGMFSVYPEDYHEQKWAGTCLWYQIRLPKDEVWEKRECSDFFERIPGLDPIAQFDYKLKRENVGDAYTTAKRSKRIAYVALIITLVEFTWLILDKIGDL